MLNDKGFFKTLRVCIGIENIIGIETLVKSEADLGIYLIQIRKIFNLEHERKI